MSQESAGFSPGVDLENYPLEIISVLVLDISKNSFAEQVQPVPIYFSKIYEEVSYESK